MSNPMSNQPSLEDKMRNLQSTMYKEVKCPSCGSVWFREAQFNRYAAGRYGAAPGADMQVISAVTQTIRVCLCGYPIHPNLSGEYEVRGRTFSNDLSSFMNSLKLASEKLESRKPEIVQSGVAEILGPEIEGVKQKIQELQNRLEELSKVSGKKVSDKPEKPAEAKSLTNRKSASSKRGANRTDEQGEPSEKTEKVDATESSDN